MEYHTRVLQQRIQVAAFMGGREKTNKRITRQKHKECQTNRYETHNADDASHDFVRETTREERDRQAPKRKKKRP